MFLAIDEYRISWWRLLHASKTKRNFFFQSTVKLSQQQQNIKKNWKTTQKTPPNQDPKELAQNCKWYIIEGNRLWDDKECLPQLKVYI